MLVLSRRVREILVIAGEIEIVVLEVEKGQVRLGIEAPSEIPVFRKELLTDKAACNPQTPKNDKTTLGLEREVK